MRRAIRAWFLLSFMLVAAPPGHAQDRLAWRDWDAGLREAKQSGRPVLVDVYTDWCGWCRRMDRDVYARPEVRAYLNSNFVVIRLDAEASDPARYEGKTFTLRSLANRFGVTGYPTTVFLRSSGEKLVSVPGYVDAGKFLLLLRYIGGGFMDRGVAWQDFVKSPGPAAR